MKNNPSIAFFGSSLFSVFCLEELKKLGILPSQIVTTADKPIGRGLKLTPTLVKVWAEENKIKCVSDQEAKADLFLVASYGKILPKEILDTPKFGTLNIHPSLLPKYRGPSPLQEQILNDEQNIGVTIMLMDEKVDHGPILAQKKVEIPNWPPNLEEFKKVLAKESTDLFANILNDWTEGKIKPQVQNHDQATFTKKVKKEDGLIDIVNGDPYKNFLKIQAYSTWPRAYFFVGQIRVIVREAEFKDGTLVIKRVLPEGKKEMSYEDFLRGLQK